MRAPLCGHRSRATSGINRDRGPQLYGLRLNGELERLRHDPDYRKGFVPELNGAAHDRRVRTELALPKTVTQND